MKQAEFIQFLNTDEKNRDPQWEQTFLESFPNCKLTMVAANPQVGPDQFPYMFVEAREDSQESALTVLKWISENGVGLALNPAKTCPDFVFTFGMIWNFVKNGQFLSSTPQPHVHGDNCNHEHLLYAGTPSQSYLPKDVREIIKEFLKQQGVMEPKVIMLSPDKENFDLCFSIEAFGSPEASEHEGILQAISWFLPAHYSIAMVSEKDLPEFETL